MTRVVRFLPLLAFLLKSDSIFFGETISDLTLSASACLSVSVCLCLCLCLSLFPPSLSLSPLSLSLSLSLYKGSMQLYRVYGRLCHVDSVRLVCISVIKHQYIATTCT